MDVEIFFVFHDLVVQVGFENSSYLVAEDTGPVSVCVTITGQLARDIVVTLSTADGSAIGKSLPQPANLPSCATGFWLCNWATGCAAMQPDA